MNTLPEVKERWGFMRSPRIGTWPRTLVWVYRKGGQKYLGGERPPSVDRNTEAIEYSTEGLGSYRYVHDGTGAFHGATLEDFPGFNNDKGSKQQHETQ